MIEDVVDADEDPEQVNLASVHAVAYDQALRAIDQQLEALEQLRGRAGLLVSTAAISASLLGGLALTRDRAADLTGWGIVGLVLAGVAFAWIAVTTVVIWWPGPVFFSLDSVVIIQQWADQKPAATESILKRDLALYLDRHRAANRDLLEQRLTWFAWALLAFLVEIIALGLAIWDVMT
jgi:hypothetical protein